MKLKTLKTLAMIMATTFAPLPSDAQTTGFEEAREFAHRRNDERKETEKRMAQIQAMLGDRNAKLTKKDLRDVIEDRTFWTDGRVLYALTPDFEDYDGERAPYEFWLAPYRAKVGIVSKFYLPGHARPAAKPKALPAFASDEGETLQMHQAGGWTLLVVRNKQGRATQMLTQVPDENGFYNQDMRYSNPNIHDAYDGHYRTTDGKDVFFGPRDLYPDVKSYNHDPGMFVGIPLAKAPFTDVIQYGGGRVSNGNPKSPNYGKMPGGGGARAIMGPMSWAIRPTADGLQAHLLHDEPFVDHAPSIGDEAQMKHVASPFGADVPGQWAFASVRPVGRGMLFRYPKSLLRLMRNEIFARHGERFASAPDVQEFFDKKPWYKPSDSPTPLSDIERLNVQVIQAEEAAREAQRRSELGQLVGVSYRYQGMAREPFGELKVKRDANGKPQLACEVDGGPWPCDERLMTAIDNLVEEYALEGLSPSYEMKSIAGERILDGYSWSVSIVYEKKTISSHGSNASPSNFRGVQLIGSLLSEEVQRHLGNP